MEEKLGIPSQNFFFICVDNVSNIYVGYVFFKSYDCKQGPYRGQVDHRLHELNWIESCIFCDIIFALLVTYFTFWTQNHMIYVRIFYFTGKNIMWYLCVSVTHNNCYMNTAFFDRKPECQNFKSYSYSTFSWRTLLQGGGNLMRTGAYKGEGAKNWVSWAYILYRCSQSSDVIHGRLIIFICSSVIYV